MSRTQKITDSVQSITAKLSGIPNIVRFRDSNELCDIISNAVEYLSAKKARKYNIDKQEVVCKVYEELFEPFDETQKKELWKRIEYLQECDMIQGIAFLNWTDRAIYNWLLRTIGDTTTPIL